MLAKLEGVGLEVCQLGPSQASTPPHADFDRKASDEGNRRESSDAVVGDEDSRRRKPGMIEGSKAPAKSSHFISNELDRTERPRDISSSDGNTSVCKDLWV